MNKFLLVAAFVGSVFATSASAEALFSASNGTVSGGATGACPLLVSDVRVNLSSNVTGAWRCDTITNSIRIGTCHAAGSRQSLTVQCAITSEDGVTPVTYNGGDDCSGTGPTDTYEIADFRGYTATSIGGSVSPQQLGGACSDTTVVALPVFE
ncbi:hypothetical protein [Saccharospirillum alexandrii]|uniref:hypothetical protein n=1 Tax=Saccharospirillum alexandrii TaxID=2448477 RepID=UPI0037362F4C